MRLLRTLSTRRLVALVAAIAVVAASGTAIAVAAGGGGGPTPPPKALPQAIHEALAAPRPQGITARIKFTNHLFPSGSLLGTVGSALMSGASGRLWLTNDGRGRLELQSDAGDVQIVWNGRNVTIYDASSNTVYRGELPQRKQKTGARDTAPSLTRIGDFLTRLRRHADVSGAQPTDVAGQAAYRVVISPKHDGGLLGSAELAWDAVHGVPLRGAIFAQGSSTPVLELTATQISYGPVPASDVDVSPPAGAKSVDLGAVGRTRGEHGRSTSVTGLSNVQAAVDFPVVAPDSLVGLPRKDVRLIGRSDSKAVLVTYGQGLGAIVVVERKTPTGNRRSGGLLSSLPKVSLDGLTAHELATQLGTVIGWQRGGVSYVLAGSLPAAAAETAARNLK
jgi:outer membrane lipoprotein-sorting protein